MSRSLPSRDGPPPNTLCLGPPHIAVALGSSELRPQRLDLRMQVTGVDRQLDALVLRFGELEPQLGVFQSGDGRLISGTPAGRSVTLD